MRNSDATYVLPVKHFSPQLADSLHQRFGDPPNATLDMINTLACKVNCGSTVECIGMAAGGLR